MTGSLKSQVLHKLAPALTTCTIILLLLSGSLTFVSSSFPWSFLEIPKHSTSTHQQQGILYVLHHNSTIIMQFPVQEGDQQINSTGRQQNEVEISGSVVIAEPPNACQPQQIPQEPTKHNHEFILLANKLDCSYRTKLESAILGNFSALLVYNDGSNSTEIIWDDDDDNDNISTIKGSSNTIPSYFIGEFNGQLLQMNYSYKTKYFIRIDFSRPIYEDVVLYVIWAGLFLIICISIYNFMRPCFYYFIHPCCIRIYRRRKHVYLVKALMSIPIVEWKSQLQAGPSPTRRTQERINTCVICIEDFTDGDHLRVLYCGHGFHQACIDRWLTHRQRCPICKSRLGYSTPSNGRYCRCCCCCCSDWETDSDFSDAEEFSTEDGIDPTGFMEAVLPRRQAPVPEGPCLTFSP